MVNYYYANNDTITLSVKQYKSRDTIERLKNAVIWEINTYLNNKYTLLDYAISKQKNNRFIFADSIVVSSLLGKSLYLYYLDDTLITPVIIDDNEVLEQHRLIDPMLNYDFFKESYAVETIDIEYFAVKNISDFKTTFIKMHKTKSRKEIVKNLKKITEVYIAIHDSTGMEISFNNTETFIDILDIVKKHCIRSEVKWP